MKNVAPARKGRQRRALVSCLLLAAMAGCAPLPTPPPQTMRYSCDNDRQFSVAIAPSRDTATIEISGMRFDLVAEPDNESGEHYSCNMLELWRTDDTARVRMDGSMSFTHCRLRP